MYLRYFNFDPEPETEQSTQLHSCRPARPQGRTGVLEAGSGQLGAHSSRILRTRECLRIAPCAASGSLVQKSLKADVKIKRSVFASSCTNQRPLKFTVLTKTSSTSSSSLFTSFRRLHQLEFASQVGRRERFRAISSPFLLVLFGICPSRLSPVQPSPRASSLAPANSFYLAAQISWLVRLGPRPAHPPRVLSYSPLESIPQHQSSATLLESFSLVNILYLQDTIV